MWKASEMCTEKLRELRKLKKINFSVRLDVRRMDTGHKMTFDNMARNIQVAKVFPRTATHSTNNVRRMRYSYIIISNLMAVL